MSEDNQPIEIEMNVDKLSGAALRAEAAEARLAEVEARLAEVEAERDHWQRWSSINAAVAKRWQTRAEDSADGKKGVR